MQILKWAKYCSYREFRFSYTFDSDRLALETMYNLSCMYINIYTKFGSHSSTGKWFTTCIKLHFIEIYPKNTIDHSILKSKEQNKSFPARKMLKGYVLTFPNRDYQWLSC